MAISRSGIRFALALSRQCARDAAMSLIRLRAARTVRLQSSARARSPSISSGIASAPMIEVERLRSGSGFGFTSNAGLSLQAPRSARNPWLRR